MIDQRSDNVHDDDIGIMVVRSSTGQLVGVYWGSRYEICNSVDEVTDPNECEFQICEAGGILFSCFLGNEEISINEYAKQVNAESDPGDTLEIACEGFAESSFDLFSKDGDWHPMVPRGYQYIAGFGLQKIESEWN